MDQYDPRRDERPPFSPRNQQQQQSAPSIAVEVFVGGFVIALLIVGVTMLLGF